MTHDEIDRLPAGERLDAMVATSLGFKYAGFCRSVGPVYEDESGRQYECGHGFRPSADWNDAMMAAEKVGLFQCHSLTNANGQWQIMTPLRLTGDLVLWASAPTGPLAIARAIAKMGVHP